MYSCWQLEEFMILKSVMGLLYNNLRAKRYMDILICCLEIDYSMIMPKKSQNPQANKLIASDQ